MGFTASGVFTTTLYDMLGNTVAFDLDAAADTPKAALYGNSGTPDKNDTAAHIAYNGAGGAWVTANELTSSPWVAGGVALSSKALTNNAGYVMYDAADVAPGGTVTLAAVYGCLVYDDTITTPVADQGICFNYFGGSQSVTGGTFTIVWHANGIFRLTT